MHNTIHLKHATVYIGKFYNEKFVHAEGKNIDNARNLAPLDSIISSMLSSLLHCKSGH